MDKLKKTHWQEFLDAARSRRKPKTGRHPRHYSKAFFTGRQTQLQKWVLGSLALGFSWDENRVSADLNRDFAKLAFGLKLGLASDGD